MFAVLYTSHFSSIKWHHTTSRQETIIFDRFHEYNQMILITYSTTLSSLQTCFAPLMPLYTPSPPSTHTSISTSLHRQQSLLSPTTALPTPLTCTHITLHFSGMDRSVPGGTALTSASPPCGGANVIVILDVDTLCIQRPILPHDSGSPLQPLISKSDSVGKSTKHSREVSPTS